MENGMMEWENETHVYEVEPSESIPACDCVEECRWTNGQCVLAVPSVCKLKPSFELSLCRTLLAREGFQVPAEDLEMPLQHALDSSSVRRFLLFNSSITQFLLTLVVYMVVWCALYSSVHLYLTLELWAFCLLCFCVSVFSILITTGIMLILHHSRKQVNMNTDVRLIQVNERLLRYKLLVGLDDTEHRFTGTLQLYFLYWDIGPCLRTLTDTLEEMALSKEKTMSTLQRRMSHLYLVLEVPDSEVEAGESAEEETPLLGRSQTLRDDKPRKEEMRMSYSLVPDLSLPVQSTAYQLLLTYSATYIRLHISNRLPSSGTSCTLPTHCTVGTVCLCQYVHRSSLK